MKKEYLAFDKTGIVNEAFLLCASCIIFERGFLFVFVSVGGTAARYFVLVLVGVGVGVEMID